MKKNPERLMRQFLSAPRDPEMDKIKKRFDALNRFVTSQNGWIVSVPGDVEVTMECLPDSTLPAELRKLGYDVSESGEGQRILPAAIVEKFTRRADGEFEPLVEGSSTKPIASTVTHAGICKVKRYAFSMPSVPPDQAMRIAP